LISNLEINGTLTSDQQKITKEQHHFYSSLYEEKLNHKDKAYMNSINNLFEGIQCPKLSETQKNFCDNSINETEILKNLKLLKNGKTPGTDGLPPEFYKFFWTDIKDFIKDSIIHAFSNNELSIEQKRGIITLIPKKTKNRLLLKNWRPISLLNTDYKIIAKILATRLQNVLPDIINEDQSGYLKNHFIGENIRLLEDVSVFTKQKKLSGIIFCIDFEKAFDSLNWNFLFNSLKIFNFGSTFISYIKTMYINIESTVINNGNSGPFFKLHRGVRQGCPLSAYLFILAMEIFAIKIRKDPTIKGIRISEDEIKISLLADDITLLLSDLKSMEGTLEILKYFRNCSGLKINIEKSCAKYIGTLSTCDYYPHGLSWIKTSPIETLGIAIVDNSDLNYKHNYAQRISNLKSLLNIWKQRSLSLKGKITVINTLALAPLIYVSSVTNTPKKAITEINNLIQNFIWNGSTSKIAQNTLIQQIDKGGLKLCHFETKIKALKITWVKRLISDSSHKWKFIPREYYQCKNLKTYFHSKHKLLSSDKIPDFYIEIHELFMKYFKEKPTNLKEILHESIWLNENITIKKKYLYLKSWENKGIIVIRDLFNEFGTLLSHAELVQKYNIKTTFLQTLQIQKSIPPSWIKYIKTHNSVLPNINHEPFIKLNDIIKPIQSVKCKELYWHIINKTEHQPSCISQWAKIYKINDRLDNNWKATFNQSFKVCRYTRIQSFQYKIITRTIATNSWLKQIKIKNDACCNFCSSDNDSIQHFFLLCSIVDQFWVSFDFWWYRATNRHILDYVDNRELQECLLLGFPGSNMVIDINTLNFCVIHAKYYIYLQKMNKCNNIDFYNFLNYLKAILDAEKYICETQNQPSKFDRFKLIYVLL